MIRYPAQSFCLLAALVVLLGDDHSRGETASSAAAALQPFVDRHEVAGVVTLVATQHTILEQSAVGFMDLESKTPMRADALFWIASQSKPIVATSMMMMVDEGKVSLDDPVTKYIPEFKDQWLIAEHDDKHTLLKKPGQPILVRHLLSHTSGMLYKTVVEQPTLDVLPLESRIHNYVMSPLQFEPGARHLYANAGINTAARIVEIVSGKSYADFIQERILDPLRMKDTTFWPTEKQLKRLAKPYAPALERAGVLQEIPNPQLRAPFSDRTRFVQPAGGLFSTASDLLNFYRMLLDSGVFEGRRLLSENAIQQMTSKQTGNLKQNYGYGLDVTPGKIGHGGTLGTLSSMDRDHGLISIFMIQYGGPGTVLNNCRQAFQKAVREKYAGEQHTPK
jgi:CubicO group peptidase (beta-lactamase class C family)